MYWKCNPPPSLSPTDSQNVWSNTVDSGVCSNTRVECLISSIATSTHLCDSLILYTNPVQQGLKVEFTHSTLIAEFCVMLWCQFHQSNSKTLPSSNISISKSLFVKSVVKVSHGQPAPYKLRNNLEENFSSIARSFFGWSSSSAHLVPSSSTVDSQQEQEGGIQFDDALHVERLLLSLIFDEEIRSCFVEEERVHSDYLWFSGV